MPERSEMYNEYGQIADPDDAREVAEVEAPYRDKKIGLFHKRPDPIAIHEGTIAAQQKENQIYQEKYAEKHKEAIKESNEELDAELNKGMKVIELRGGNIHVEAEIFGHDIVWEGEYAGQRDYSSLQIDGIHVSDYYTIKGFEAKYVRKFREILDDKHDQDLERLQPAIQDLRIDRKQAEIQEEDNMHA